MIHVHLINDTPIVLNSDLIEMIEATPDTVVSLSTGKKVIIKESIEQIISMVVEYRRKLAAPIEERCAEKKAA